MSEEHCEDLVTHLACETGTVSIMTVMDPMILGITKGFHSSGRPTIAIPLSVEQRRRLIELLQIPDQHE